MELESIQPYTNRQGRTHAVMRFARSKERYVTHIPRHVAEALANYFRTTVDQSRQMAREFVPSGTRRNPPLVLSRDMTLVGVKCRRRNAGLNTTATIGYLVLEQINRIYRIDGGRKAEISFLSGNRLVVHQSYRSVRDACRLGRQLKEMYEEELKTKRKPITDTQSHNHAEGE